MDWKELLEKMRLAEIQASLETEQFGIVNVKVENYNFNFHFPDTEAVKKLKQTEITPDVEKAIKEEAKKRLENVGTSLQAVSDSAATEMISGTAIISAIDLISKKKPED